MSTVLGEAVELVSASERIRAMTLPLQSLLDSIDHVAEVAPDLEPELAQIRERLSEAVDHMQAAMNVLQAKLDLLKERT